MVPLRGDSDKSINPCRFFGKGDEKYELAYAMHLCIPKSKLDRIGRLLRIDRLNTRSENSQILYEKPFGTYVCNCGDRLGIR